MTTSKEKESDLIIHLAKKFIGELNEIEPEFERAFYRFYVEDRMYESSSSYTTSDDVYIVSAFDSAEFFEDMDKMCLELMQEMQKVPALLLLSIDKNFDYKIQFEYADFNKWNISLLDEASGIPTE